MNQANLIIVLKHFMYRNNIEMFVFMIKITGTQSVRENVICFAIPL